MMIEVILFAPGTGVVRTAESKYEVSLAEYKDYQRLAQEVNSHGGVSVLVQMEGELHLAGASAAMVVDLVEAERAGSGVPSRTILLESLPNDYLRMARLGLLGAVTADGLYEWRSGNPGAKDAVIGLRSVATPMNAVGDSVLGAREYCTLRGPDLTSLPLVINRYLRAAFGESQDAK